jgi:colanic acid/amylovoran biosynthesis glycosyltransferase
MTAPQPVVPGGPLAYIINQYPKGSHTFIRREIVELERQGWRVQRIALRGHDGDLHDAADRDERARTAYVMGGWRDALALAGASLALALVRPRHFARAAALTLRMGWRGLRPLPYHFFYLAQACRIALWLRASGARHVHAHFGTNAAQVAMLTTALGGPPYSFTVHGPEEFDSTQGLRLREKIQNAAFVIAISAFGRSQLFRCLPHQEWHKVHVVRCGLASDYAEGPATPLPSMPRLVCLGRLCEQKGQLLLLEAVAQLRAAGIAVQLVLAGDGELYDELQALAIRLGLQKIVHITGWLDGAQVQAEIRAARAVVLPSFAEGLPVALMEAMALQRPVLSTYVAGIPELVMQGHNGWLVPAGDVDALARALAVLLATPLAELERMGRNGSRQVKLHHSLEHEVAELGKHFMLSGAQPQTEPEKEVA